jgi:hypothetical protein
MRINYKNFALGLIDDPKNFNFAFPDNEENGGGITPKLTPKELREFGNSLLKSSELIKQMCGGNIQCISKTFSDAFAKGFEKLKPLFYKEEVNESGILLVGNYSEFTHTHTYYYAVKTIKDEAGKIICYDIVFMDFSNYTGSKLYGLDVYLTIQSDLENGKVNEKQIIWNGHINTGKDATYWEVFIIAFCFFKKYCEIETKETSPKNRRAKVAGNKYLNETDKRITILDSTWFTNLVVSGAFNVSGHLRWQACGPGLKERKLIWVAEYEKEGYTRKAKAIQGNGSK